MCSWTPKISCTTRTTGRFLSDEGFARYAGILPSGTGIFTSPATSPAASVVIVSARTGRTARANPTDKEVTKKLRRLYSCPAIETEFAISLRPPSRLLDQGCECVQCGIHLEDHDALSTVGPQKHATEPAHPSSPGGRDRRGRARDPRPDLSRCWKRGPLRAGPCGFALRCEPLFRAMAL